MHLLLRTTLLLRLGDVMRVDACDRHSEYSRVVHGLVPPRSLALSFGARSARSPALANCGYCSGAGSFGSPPRSPPGYAPRTQRKHSRSSCLKRPAARRRRSGRPSLARFGLFVAPSGGGSIRVDYDIDPLRVRRWLGVVVVMPVPPLVRRGLGVTLWRVLPSLLTAQRRDIEVAPSTPHRLVAAVVNEICAEHL